MQDLLSVIPIAKELNPLLIVSFVLLAGGLGGWLARLCRVPSITGNILAGLVIGPSVLGVIQEETMLEAMQPLAAFATGLITVSIGSHLSYRRLHNAWKRVVLMSLGEISGAFFLVLGTVYWLTDSWVLSLLLACLSIDTAPATVIHIVRECHAKGTFVKTLLSVVALGNIHAIFLFAIVNTLVTHQYTEQSASLGEMFEWSAWILPGWELIGAIFLGLLVGLVVKLLVRHPQFHNFSTIFVAILISTGLSRYLGVSNLLTTLVLGAYLGNSTQEVEEQLGVLEPIESMLFICFFTLAGVTLHVQELQHIGLLGVGFFGARIIGKALGSFIGGVLSGSSRRLSLNLPLALIPQAGVVIALLFLLQGNQMIPAEVRTAITTVVLASVMINEIVGPLFTKIAIKRAKEDNKDRPRLIEFMHEEFIKTNIKATDKWDALRQMCDFLIRCHRVEHMHPDELYKTVEEREKSDSTAIGKGAAIPHGIVPTGPNIQGVMGILSHGVDWDSPDGQPVRLVVLIATPQNHQAMHLKTMASLAAMISHEVIRTRLMNAANANDVWEIIESEETPDFNYFLQD